MFLLIGGDPALEKEKGRVFSDGLVYTAVISQVFALIATAGIAMIYPTERRSWEELPPVLKGGVLRPFRVAKRIEHL
jgi:hypothetical protein